MKKRFVQFGAGNIGRGFIGALFAKSGWDVIFIDVANTVIEALNSKNCYTVEIVSNEGSTYETIEGVRCVDARLSGEAENEIARADCMATAVGANVLPLAAPTIAAGLRRRWDSGRAGSFNIIICENLIDADKLLGEWVCGHLANEGERRRFLEEVGLVEASIGRMVPLMTPEDRAKDPLWVRVERYCELPVDGDAIKGEPPQITGLHPVSPFAFYIRRKLFLHNMSHALTAYIGAISGYEYIWQAIGDANIKLLTERAMLESAAALSDFYGVPLEGILDHVFDLLLRYGNRALGDTVARVGGDSFRKIGAQDRLAGAAAFCCDAGVEPVYICAGLAAALFFKSSPEDQGTARIQEMLKSEGVDAVLQRHAGLGAYRNVLDYTARYIEVIRTGQANSGDLLVAAEEASRDRLSGKPVI
ncbi:MAG: mannitol dehydrogenase [Oscillospiraceae bacterium]|nr:mannitol dehydrogenase [Oscillospiraceae bacterium]